MDEATNFSPLFKPNGKNGGVSTRSMPSLRNVSSYLDYNTTALSFDDWTNLYDRISGTTPFKTMYPLNILDFSPTISITQIRQPDKSHFVISRFGHITYEDGTESWNMLSQDIIDSGLDVELDWWSAEEIAPGIYSLLGRSPYNYFVGIQDSAEGVKVLWNEGPFDSLNCTQAQYGRWSNDSDEFGMMTFCDGEVNMLFRFNSLEEAPVMAGLYTSDANVLP